MPSRTYSRQQQFPNCACTRASIGHSYTLQIITLSAGGQVEGDQSEQKEAGGPGVEDIGLWKPLEGTTTNGIMANRDRPQQPGTESETAGAGTQLGDRQGSGLAFASVRPFCLLRCVPHTFCRPYPIHHVDAPSLASSPLPTSDKQRSTAEGPMTGRHEQRWKLLAGLLPQDFHGFPSPPHCEVRGVHFEALQRCGPPRIPRPSCVVMSPSSCSPALAVHARPTLSCQSSGRAGSGAFAMLASSASRRRTTTSVQGRSETHTETWWSVGAFIRLNSGVVVVNHRL